MGVEAGCQDVPEPFGDVIVPLLPISIPGMFIPAIVDGCPPPVGALMSILLMSCLCGAAGAGVDGTGISVFAGAGAVDGAAVSAGISMCL